MNDIISKSVISVRPTERNLQLAATRMNSATPIADAPIKTFYNGAPFEQNVVAAYAFSEDFYTGRYINNLDAPAGYRNVSMPTNGYLDTSNDIFEPAMRKSLGSAISVRCDMFDSAWLNQVPSISQHAREARPKLALYQTLIDEESELVLRWQDAVEVNNENLARELNEKLTVNRTLQNSVRDSLDVENFEEAVFRVDIGNRTKATDFLVSIVAQERTTKKIVSRTFLLKSQNSKDAFLQSQEIEFSSSKGLSENFYRANTTGQTRSNFAVDIPASWSAYDMAVTIAPNQLPQVVSLKSPFHAYGQIPFGRNTFARARCYLDLNPESVVEKLEATDPTFDEISVPTFASNFRSSLKTLTLDSTTSDNEELEPVLSDVSKLAYYVFQNSSSFIKNGFFPLSIDVDKNSGSGPKTDNYWTFGLPLSEFPKFYALDMIAKVRLAEDHKVESVSAYITPDANSPLSQDYKIETTTDFRIAASGSVLARLRVDYENISAALVRMQKVQREGSPYFRVVAQLKGTDGNLKISAPLKMKLQPLKDMKVPDSGLLPVSLYSQAISAFAVPDFQDMIQAGTTAFMAVANQNLGSFKVNDGSLPYGGEFAKFQNKRVHASHDSGRSLDIRSPGRWSNDRYVTSSPDPALISFKNPIDSQLRISDYVLVSAYIERYLRDLPVEDSCYDFPGPRSPAECSSILTKEKCLYGIRGNVAASELLRCSPPSTAVFDAFERLRLFYTTNIDWLIMLQETIRDYDVELVISGGNGTRAYVTNLLTRDACPPSDDGLSGACVVDIWNAMSQGNKQFGWNAAILTRGTFTGGVQLSRSKPALQGVPNWDFIKPWNALGVRFSANNADHFGHVHMQGH